MPQANIIKAGDKAMLVVPNPLEVRRLAMEDHTQFFEVPAKSGEITAIWSLLAKGIPVVTGANAPEGELVATPFQGSSLEAYRYGAPQGVAVEVNRKSARFMSPATA